MNIDKIPLNDILLFMAVVEAKSFSHAAKKLDLDVSSLSKRIIRLEANLKTQLLQRTTRQMTLTEAGHLLYQHAEHLKEELQALHEDISRLHSMPTGKLRIKAPMSLGHTHLVYAIQEFLRQYPQIQCELILGEHSTNLIREEIDILISIKSLDNVDLIAKQVGHRSTGIYASPDYLKKCGIPRLPQDLHQHNCLLHLGRNEKNFWPFEMEGQTKRILVKGNFCANSNAALMSAAEAGLGLVKLPSFMVQDSLKHGKLQQVLNIYAPLPSPIYAVYTKHRALPQKIKLFVNFLQEYFANLPME